MLQYTEHAIISSIVPIPVTCREVITEPLNRIYFTSYVQFAIHSWKKKSYTFNPWEWPASNFSLQYHPWIKHWSHENHGYDQQLTKLLIFKQILLVSALGDVQRTVWRICTLMSGCRGLIIKCMFKVAILYSYYLFTNTIFYLADCSFNRCQKYVYEKLADTVLCIVLVKTAVQE